MIPFFSTGMYTGPVARALGGADIAMLVGLPVAAAAYYLACRSMDVDQDRLRAAAADAGLTPMGAPAENTTLNRRSMAGQLLLVRNKISYPV